MITQAILDDLSDLNWVAVTSADQVTFVTPILNASEDSWTHGVVVWRIDAAGYAQLVNAEAILLSLPPYVDAFDIIDVGVDFSTVDTERNVAQLIAGEESADTVRTETPSLDLRRLSRGAHCEVGARERHTTLRIYSSSIAMAAIRYLWENREEKRTLTEEQVRARLPKRDPD